MSSYSTISTFIYFKTTLLYLFLIIKLLIISFKTSKIVTKIEALITLKKSSLSSSLSFILDTSTIKDTFYSLIF